MASVTRRTSANRAERRAETARRLGEATRELIAEGQSVTRLSIDKLCGRAGIARSTFYAHFADKGELLGLLFADILDDLHTANRRWWDLGPVTRAELRTALGSLVRHYHPHRHLIAAAFDLSSYDTDTRALITRAMNGSIGELAAHIERGQRAGWVDPDLEPAQTASWIIWMVERGQRGLLDVDGPGWEHDLDGYTQVIWDSLYRFV